MSLLVALGMSVLGAPKNAQGQPADRSILSPDRQALVAISADTARGDLEELRESVAEGLDAGLTVNEIKEALVHLYAYCGFPRSLQGLETFRTVLRERAARGIDDDIGAFASPRAGTRDEYALGEQVLATIAAMPQTRPQSGYPAFSPEIERYLKEHLFADIFGRDVLSYSDREIVTISALASMDGVEPMLESHLGVGLNTGLSERQLRQILTVIASEVSEAKAEQGRRLLTEVLAARPETSGAIATGPIRGADGNEHGVDPARLEIDTVFPQGTRVANDNFTGAVWLEMLVTDTATFDSVIGNVTFEPGARTDWHSHPGGQILLVTAGSGYHQERGGPIQLLRKGDVVEVLPGVEHWHGATPESAMTHVALGTNSSAGGAVWLQPVTDEEYHSTW